MWHIWADRNRLSKRCWRASPSVQLTTGHQVALTTIGYVGCSISIFCLAITLVTFAVLSWVSSLRPISSHIWWCLRLSRPSSALSAPSVTRGTTSTPTCPSPSWWRRSFCSSVRALTPERWAHLTRGRSGWCCCCCNVCCPISFPVRSWPSCFISSSWAPSPGCWWRVSTSTVWWWRSLALKEASTSITTVLAGVSRHGGLWSKQQSENLHKDARLFLNKQYSGIPLESQIILLRKLLLRAIITIII